MKKTGRLSIKERQKILSLITKINPVDIAKKLNRDIAPIYNMLNVHMPEWRNVCQNIHKEYLEKERQILIGEGDWKNVKEYLPEYKEETKEIELNDLTCILDEINEIKTELEIKSKLEQKQLELINALKKKLEKQIKHQESEFKKSFEFQKIEMNKLTILQMENYAARKVEESKNDKFNKEIPTPKYTKQELVVSKNQKIINDLAKPGLYFLWRDNHVRYVGRAKILKNRLRKHDKIKSNDLVSYIVYEDNKYFADELFYIWKCYPYNYLNNEVSKALEEENE